MDDRLNKMRVLKRRCEIDQAMWKNELIEVGEFTYGTPVVLQWDKTTRLKVGKFCSIGANIQIYLGGEHHTDTVTTYPFDVLMGEAETKSKGDVEIGNDVWIGNNVQILSGVKIGNGAVIGAGSVIARDVDPYTIMIGNPAKILRRRNCPRMAWWDWPLEKLAEAIPILMSRNEYALKMLDENWEAEHE